MAPKSVVIYFSVTNCPQTQQLKTALSLSFCGSGIMWGSAGHLWLRVSQGCTRCGLGLESSQDWTGKDPQPSSLTWLVAGSGHHWLALDISSLPCGPLHKATHNMAVCFLGGGLWERASTQDERHSLSVVTKSQKAHPITFARFYQLKGATRSILHWKAGDEWQEAGITWDHLRRLSHISWELAYWLSVLTLKQDYWWLLFLHCKMKEGT